MLHKSTWLEVGLFPGACCEAARLSEGGLSSSTVGPGWRRGQEVLGVTWLGDSSGVFVIIG